MSLAPGHSPTADLGHPDPVSDLGGLLRHHPAAPGRLSDLLHRRPGGERPARGPGEGGRLKDPLQPGQALLPTVPALAQRPPALRVRPPERRLLPLGPGQRGPHKIQLAAVQMAQSGDVLRVEQTRNRAGQGALYPDHDHLPGHPALHLGHGHPHRDLLGGEAVLPGRLCLLLRGLHRSGHAQFPAGSDFYVRRLHRLRSQRGRAFFARVPGGGLVPGADHGPDRPSVDSGGGHRHGRHGRADPDHAGQPVWTNFASSTS